MIADRTDHGDADHRDADHADLWNRSGWKVAAVCLLLAIVHTWPLATAPGTLSRNDNADAQLNEWIMAWVAHQLPRDPARLFDANIFYPARHSLAFSEPLIVPALVGAPLAWLGASPVLVYNIVLLVGFALTAWAVHLLVFEWTNDRAAGILAGSMFAFNSHTLTRLAHIQAIHAWGLPLALLASDRLIARARWHDAIWLALWMTCLAYTSGYLIVFGAVMVGVAVALRSTDWWPRAGAVLSRFAGAALIAAVAALPVYLPYRAVARDEQMVRSLHVVGEYSMTPLGYLASAGRIHHSTWSAPFARTDVDYFFPGFLVVLLAIGAAYWAFRAESSAERRRVIMLGGIAAAGFVLSLGTHTPVYGWIYAAFPPMQGLRVAARFGNLFLLGISALAGLGLAAARRRLPPRRAGLIVAAIMLAANIESLRAPIGYTRFEGIPAIYSLLATEPGRVVLVEVPFFPREAFFGNGPYVLNSTAHWRPLMNGYSGYMPVSYLEYSRVFWYFPEERAILAMRRAGATHVIIHPEGFLDQQERMWRTVAASPYLERIAIGTGGLALYRLR